MSQWRSDRGEVCATHTPAAAATAAGGGSLVSSTQWGATAWLLLLLLRGSQPLPGCVWLWLRLLRF